MYITLVCAQQGEADVTHHFEVRSQLIGINYIFNHNHECHESSLQHQSVSQVVSASIPLESPVRVPSSGRVCTVPAPAEYTICGSYVGPLMPKRPYSYCPRYKTHIYILFLLRRRLPPPLRALRKRVFARRFQEREEFKKEMCRKMNTSGKILTNYFMYYNKEYKLLLCAPPKTGCSSLKRHLLRLVGFPENINVHSDQARRAIAVRQVLGDDLQEVLQSTFPSTRAMVARDPLDRIVSGYKDKFRNGDQVTGMWANYMTRYRMRRGFNTSNMTITFDQYLEMIANIMETYGRNSIDRHFRATSLLCSPCSVDYEYILHTDTLTQDLQYIVEQLNITDIDLGLRLDNRTRTSSYENYYRTIPDSLMRRIYALYKDDFLISNFTLPPFLRDAIQGDRE
nr:carbohydrate sulfotransferase 10-like [Penaeus vannamei]